MTGSAVQAIALMNRVVLGAQRVRGAESGALQGVAQVAGEDIGLAKTHQPPNVPSLSGAAV